MRLRAAAAGLEFERREGGRLGYFARFAKPGARAGAASPRAPPRAPSRPRASPRPAGRARPTAPDRPRRSRSPSRAASASAVHRFDASAASGASSAVAGLVEEPRVHRPEVASARAAALDHLEEEARAPLPVLGGLGPRPDLGRRTSAARAGPGTRRAPARSSPSRRGRPRRAPPRGASRRRAASPSGRSTMWPSSWKIGCFEWRASARFSSFVVWSSSKPVSESSASLGVVAGDHHGVAGEVGRLAVVVEVVEVGEEQGGAAGVDGVAGELPGGVGVGVGPQPQRRAGQLEEVLLQLRGPPVREARGRLPVERDVEEAGPGAEAEGHLLGQLGAVEGEQVAERGRAAVVARACACSRGPSPALGGASASRIAVGFRSFRYAARSRKLWRISEVSSSRNSWR